jgi:cytochrome b561
MSRSTTSRADHYAAPQIALHWAVVALVVVQWFSHDAMEDFWDRVEDGAASGLPDNSVALIHLASGAGILVLMLIRIVARRRFGAPPLPADMSPLLKLAARLNHYAFYVVLILLPLSGASAILLGIEAAADVHSTLVPLLFLLLAAHLAGVAFHAFIRRDGVVWRMLKPRPDGTPAPR